MSKIYTLEDVKSLSVGRECWIVIHNKVYNVTEFLADHPGGEEVIRETGGTDATKAFEAIGHSEDATKLLKEYLVGELCTE